MNQSQGKFEGQKTKIITQIAELSRLLGMIPSDDTIKIHEPVTQNKMVLSDWLSATRDSFLRAGYSVAIGETYNSLIQFLQDYILDCAIHTLAGVWVSAADYQN
jgi:hypothetical protein